jgi:hypothetical protein
MCLDERVGFGFVSIAGVDRSVGRGVLCVYMGASILVRYHLLRCGMRAVWRPGWARCSRLDDANDEGVVMK